MFEMIQGKTILSGSFILRLFLSLMAAVWSLVERSFVSFYLVKRKNGDYCVNRKGWEYWWERAYGTLDSHQESPVIRSGVCNGFLQADLCKTKYRLERSELRRVRIVNIAYMHSSSVWPLSRKCFC